MMISKRLFDLELVTPDGEVFNGKSMEFVVPGCLGEMVVLGGHEPLVSMLIPGVTQYYDKDQNHHSIATGSGFLTIANDKVQCVVDFAAKAEDLDLEELNADLEKLEAKRSELTDSSYRQRLACIKAMQKLLTH